MELPIDKPELPLYMPSIPPQGDGSTSTKLVRDYGKGGYLNKAFKRWFGNSVLVDENGNPQMFFHGTKKNFTEFKATRFGDGLLFFHSDPDFTEQMDKGK